MHARTKIPLNYPSIPLVPVFTYTNLILRIPPDAYIPAADKIESAKSDFGTVTSRSL
jgi:hypothetical protein